MPELPDVEVFKRYFDRTALHRRIANAAIGSERILEEVSSGVLIGHLRGHRFERSRRHGKYLFAELDDHTWVVFHFGMTGRFETFRGQPPKGAQLVLDFETGLHLALVMPRKLGRVGLTGNPEEYVDAKGLGIDVLDRKLTFARFRQLAGEHGGMVKCWLMDQSILAGLGNIYSDEVLFQAQIPPQRKLEALDETALKQLYSRTHRVVEAAIEHQADPEKMPRSFLLPHRREGAPCPRCGGKITRIRVCGRTAWYCPDCQGS